MTQPETLVVKLGGAAVDRPAVAESLLRQVAACRAAGMHVAVVHGGGARLTALASRLGYESRFVGGRRVTDDGMLEAAKMVFAGSTGTDLAALARRCGVPAVALSAVSGGMLKVKRRPVRDGVDFGWVGDVQAADPGLLTTLMAGGYVPLVASLAADDSGQVLNVNADTVACALAAALTEAGLSTRLVVLTDTDGVRRDAADPASRVPRLTVAELDAFGSASGGMLPKLQSIAACLAAGVASVQVASWQTVDVLTACLSGGDVGTVIASGMKRGSSHRSVHP